MAVNRKYEIDIRDILDPYPIIDTHDSVKR